jgi:hypothetical protein
MKGWIICLCVLVPIICVVGFVVRGGGCETPRATFETMIEAAKAQDKDGVMACFSKETRGYLEELERFGEEMGGSSTDANMTDKFKGTMPIYGAEKITGNTATLEITIKGQRETVNFLKEGGGWKIHIPELKMIVQMMRGMGDSMQDMMKGMTEAMTDAMEESTEEYNQNFDETIEQMEQNR